ncbi:hypothetical protein FJY63_13000, partial [Candidatus Sumerlaeota bacterium]|nr:hypothetical protein [Candidatus Sumerlaeota bacterium]
MFRGKSMWVSKCAIAILVGGFLFASLSRAAMAAGVGDGSDDAIFLTKAVEREVVVFDRKHRLWEPTTGTISFAWSDQPFAVHIPWNVEVETLKTIPYMGAPVAQSISTKEYDLTFALRGLSFQENNQINVSNFCVLSSGLYRFDGEPLDIRLADGKPPYEGRILFSDRDTWADLPNLDARADSKPSKRHIRPMSKAAPGRVAFFFVLDPRSPQNRGNARPEYTPPYHWADAGIRHWPHWKEECSARMSVTIDVVDRKELPSDNPNLPPVRISYQETPRQIATKEADIQVRQNGWVIRKATPSIAGDWNAQVNNPASSDWAVRLQDLGTEVHGTSFTAGHRLVATTKQQDRSDYNMTVDVKIDVGLPSRIWDHMPSVGSCNVRQIAASAPIAAQRLDTGLLTGVYGARDWNAVILTGWYYNVTNPTGPPLLGYFFSGGVSTPDSIQGHLFDNDRFTEDPNTRLRTYRTEFPIAPLYGQALPTSWTAWTPIENHRLLTLDIRCTNYLLKDRSDLRQPISDSFPRRHVDFYATRLSEIVSNKVGVTVSDQAVAGPETEDDGYWDWIVRYDK